VSKRSSENRFAENDSIYLVDGDKAFGEMERAIGISVMGVGGEGGGLFSNQIEGNLNSGDLVEFKKLWFEWLREKFRAQLSEVFVEVFMASTEMRIDRIAELDLELNQRLSDEEQKKSRQAGSWFLEGKSDMQSAPQWQKYARCVEQESCPGHVITVFALQASLYHLPLLSALTSYVYFEWRAGLLAFAKEGKNVNVELSAQSFHEKYPESMEVVREVFSRNFQAERSISSL